MSNTEQAAAMRMLMTIVNELGRCNAREYAGYVDDVDICEIDAHEVMQDEEDEHAGIGYYIGQCCNDYPAELLERVRAAYRYAYVTELASVQRRMLVERCNKLKEKQKE